MSRSFIVLVLLIAATPARAQVTAKNISDCESNDTDVSIAACTTMLQARPEMLLDYREAAYMHRAFAYSMKGFEDLAIADLTKAIALKPDLDTLATLYLARGRSYYNKSSLQPSHRRFDADDCAEPRYADAYKMRASAYQMKGQLNYAIADYREALKLDPDAQAVKDVLKRLGATP